MSVISTQSDIAEVRDQMSLDYADGKYLNTVTSNLGLQRPPFGFTDAQWRAIGRVLALQYKQIRTKFEAVLSIILGPKITQCGAFLSNVAAGDKHGVLVNSEQFPQVGVMVIDEGLGTEESAEYIFIDRYTNTVYFKDPLQFSHTAVGQTWESGIISDYAIGASFVNVFDTSGFPSGTYTINVGRGTPTELAGPIGTVGLDARKIGVPVTLGGLGASTVLGTLIGTDGTASQIDSFFARMLSVESIPATGGWLQSSQLSTTYTATAGTVTTVTVAGPVSASRYGGFWIRFNGNVTGALTDKIAYVEDNSTTVFTFGNTLAVPPVAGDTFVVLNNFQYIRAEKGTESVLMRRELPDHMVFPINTEFTVLRPQATVTIAQVQVKGTNWDIFETDPHHVEILLPAGFLTNDLRTASYIRETGMSGTSAADAIRNIGDTDISVGSTSALPSIAVVEHNGAVKNRYAYYVPHAWVTEDAAVGAVTLKVTDTSQFFTTGTLRYGASTVLYTVVDATTLTTAPLPVAVRVSAIVRDEKRIRLAKPLLGAVAVADTVNYYVNYVYGDTWNVDDVWPGPYVWSLFAETHKKESTPGNTFTSTVSGPTTLAVDRVLGATVFELVDASSFPTAVPYEVLLGENSGNVETLAVQQLSLKSRTYEVTTVAVDPTDVVPQIVMTSLAGPTPPANQFPNGGPYRVMIDPLSPNQEVLEVSGTTGGNTLLLSQPATLHHNVGVRVVLFSDLIRVSPAAADDHMGNIKYTDRFGFYAAESQAGGADTVRPLYTQATLALGGTDFQPTADTMSLNFGEAVGKASARLSVAFSAGASTATVVNSSVFPVTGYPYTVTVDVGAGPLKQEVLHVTNNNTGTNVLTFSHPAVFSHSSGRRIEFTPGPEENISYTSRVGAVLTFDPYIQVANTHYTMEYVAPSVGTGYPRRNGFDFPLRLPVTVQDRVQFIVDLVRAAGVEVTFVDKR